jgi:hypothetical protein
MARTNVQFTEWLPDQPGLIGALIEAKNIYPKAVGYGPFPEATDISAAASEDLNNAVAAKDASTTKIFAGGSTKLFLLDSTDLSLDDVSATTYTTTENWRFTQFGSYLIAANGSEPLQYYDMDASTTFANLDAAAPTAKFVTVVRDFVVTGNNTTSSSEVVWSGINNPNTWSSSAVTQSDSQDIPDGGEVRGITGGEFGLVLLERSIQRMSYVGTPLVFQFDNISRNLGCYESQSVIQWQGITYFLSDDGFYACNGEQVVGIGAEKVDRFFFSTLNEALLSTMSAAVDPIKNLIVWGYPSNDESYYLLMYHLPTKRWSYAETNVNRVASFSTPSATLEGLDTYNASIDALGISLDSRQWIGGKMVFGGVRGAKIISFTGDPQAASIVTNEIHSDNNATMVTLAKPIVDGGSASVAVASRFLLSDTPNFGSDVAADSDNRVGIRSVGRYHRFRVTPSGSWETAISLDIDIQPAGMR